MERLMQGMRTGRLYWIASSALVVEIENNPDELRRSSALSLLCFASEIHRPSAVSAARGSNSTCLVMGNSMRCIWQWPRSTTAICF